MSKIVTETKVTPPGTGQVADPNAESKTSETGGKKKVKIQLTEQQIRDRRVAGLPDVKEIEIEE